MNDMLTTELAMELGMQKAYVGILHRIIKNSVKNQAILDNADRLLADKNCQGTCKRTSKSNAYVGLTTYPLSCQVKNLFDKIL